MRVGAVVVALDRRQCHGQGLGGGARGAGRAELLGHVLGSGGVRLGCGARAGHGLGREQHAGAAGRLFGGLGGPSAGVAGGCGQRVPGRAVGLAAPPGRVGIGERPRVAFAARRFPRLWRVSGHGSIGLRGRVSAAF